MPTISNPLRFGPFELDLHSGELHKNGMKIRLADQPLQILTLLLERPGQVVTREELRQRLWSSETFVDFEHGLNAAVKRLREALGDSADTPRFIETLPRHGYRFIFTAPVDGPELPAPASNSSVVASRRTKTAVALTVITVIRSIAAVAGLLALIHASRVSSGQRLVLAAIEEPAGFDFAYVSDGAPVLSPDDQRMAVVAATVTGPHPGSTIIVHTMSSGVAVPLAGTEGGTFPFWSPDGKHLGFFAHGKLEKAELGGGPVQVLCDAPDGRGGSWSQSGTIVFAPETEGPLMAVSDGGGTPSALPAARKEVAHFSNRNPVFLPDGKHFLFTVRGGNETVGSVYAGSLDGSEPKQVLTAASNIAYSDGYLFYLKEGTLTAQRFDAAGLYFEDKPVSVAANIEYYNPRDIGYFSVGRNALVYRTAALHNRDLVLLDLSGKELERWGEPAAFVGGSISPSGQISILRRENANGRGNSLWLADVQRQTVTRLTADLELTQTGVAAADGNSVFIATTNNYGYSTVVRRWLAAPHKEEKLLEDSRGSIRVTSVSRDGRYLFFIPAGP